jgi:MFS family permease
LRRFFQKAAASFFSCFYDTNPVFSVTSDVMSARTFTHEEIVPVIRGVALCILLAALDQTVIVPAVPSMARDLGGSGHLAWIVSSYLLTGTAATPIFGKLSDIYGRRRLLQPALILFCAASLGCAAAQNFDQIILFRAIQGIGGAGLITIAQVAIADVTAWQARRAPAPILPLHLFANDRVRGGLLLSFTNTLCTFGASLLLPLYFQYIRHTSAAVSGLLTTPFLLAFVAMSYAGGHVSRRLGRTKPTILVALALCLLGLLGLAAMGKRTPLGMSVLYGVVLGSGIGLVQPNITVAIQNAVERRDVAVATGAMLLFRAIGGAFGATIAGVMLLAHGFAGGFGACAAVAGLALLIGLAMRDDRLRS